MVASGTPGHSPGKDVRDNLAQDRGDNLHDDALESEIEMVSELVVAATSSDGPMDQDEVDLLLGVDLKVVEPVGEADS